MSAYSIALFLHIAGAMGFFAALGLEWAGMTQLRKATSAEQVRTLLEASGSLKRVSMFAMMTLMLAGLYMMVTVWGGIAWLIVSFVAIALMMIVMGRITTPRLKAIRQAATDENGALSLTLVEALRHPMLWMGIQSRIIMAFGIVFLMTVKPDWVGSLVTLGSRLLSVWFWPCPCSTRNRHG